MFVKTSTDNSSMSELKNISEAKRIITMFNPDGQVKASLQHNYMRILGETLLGNDDLVEPHDLSSLVPLSPLMDLMRRHYKDYSPQLIYMWASAMATDMSRNLVYIDMESGMRQCNELYQQFHHNESGGSFAWKMDGKKKGVMTADCTYGPEVDVPMLYHYVHRVMRKIEPRVEVIRLGYDETTGVRSYQIKW